MTVAARLLRALVLGYRWTLAPLLGPRCRFLPSCSEYALDALARHGALRGSWLTLLRLGRCHPWGGSGYDPVPPVPPAADRHNSAPYRAHIAPILTLPGTPEAP
jgi:hypothetical protein